MPRKTLGCRFSTVTLLTIGVSLFFSPKLQAAQIRIDPTNLLCNNATGDPYCSLKSAVSAAVSGDTISLATGTYIERDISITKNLTINGADARTTFIDGNQIAPRIFTIASGTTVTLSNLTIRNGKDEGSHGGAIKNEGDLTISKVTLIGNSSSVNGGAIYNTGNGVLSLKESTISSNTAVYGGGLWHYTTTGYLTIDNCTLSGNATTLSGGAMSLDGHATITNSTIAYNNADSDLSDDGHAGGIAVGDFTWGLYAMAPWDVLYIYLRNTIIAQNRDLSPSQTTPPHDCRGPIYSLGYNLIEIPTSCGEGGTFNSGLSTDIVGPYPPTYTIAVNLDSLKNNGGPTDTRTLSSGSLAIDAGDATNCPSQDQRGFGRPGDGNNDGKAVCDIGAYENRSCGDGILDSTEKCDDGNRSNSDSCLSSCVVAACGDGYLYTGQETCDNGSQNNNTTPNACRTNCQKPSCGDGVTDNTEGCDDANTDNTDSCLTTCVSATCGDGVVRKNLEECDEGAKNSNSPNAPCRTNCTFSKCGDGVVDAVEECDEGIKNSESPDATCRTDCTEAFCGDGIVDSLYEECDEGAKNSDDPDAICRTSCVLAGCGDGVIDSSEECDEGGKNSSEPDASCRPDCTHRRCGDGIIDSDEFCEENPSSIQIPFSLTAGGCAAPAEVFQK